MIWSMLNANYYQFIWLNGVSRGMWVYAREFTATGARAIPLLVFVEVS